MVKSNIKKTKRTYKKRTYKKKSFFGKSRNFVKVKSLVIPRAQLVRVKEEFVGYIAPSAGKNNGYATIWAGTLLAPFNSLAPITQTQFGTLNPMTGCNIGDAFSGYPVMSTQYSNYKVMGAKLSMVVRPEGSSDTIIAGAFPWISSNQTNITSMTTDEYMEQPFGVSKTCYSQKDSDKIICKISPHKVIGCTKLQYKVLGDYVGLTGQPQANYNFNYNVFWRTADNADLSANLIFRFTLERIVYFYGANNLLN